MGDCIAYMSLLTNGNPGSLGLACERMRTRICIRWPHCPPRLGCDSAWALVHDTIQGQVAETDLLSPEEAPRALEQAAADKLALVLPVKL